MIRVRALQAVIVGVGWSAAAFLASPAAEAEHRRIAVEDVVQMALASNPRLGAVRARAESADAQRSSAGGRLLPSVRLNEEYQHWDSPFEIAFGGNTVRARAQDTNSFSAAADQPVLGLLRLREDYRERKSNAEAATAGVRVAEAVTRESLEVQYLRLFEAGALENVAKASEAELTQQIAMTEAKLKAGAATNADLLRVQVARANARQQAIVARTQARVARAYLLSAIGLSPTDEEIEFAEPTLLLAKGEQATIDTGSSEQRALSARPELFQARASAEAAEHAARARGYALLPDIDVEAAYVRTDGQVFAPKNSAFVGVRAQWAVWEWGATWQARKAAQAQAEAAYLELDNTKRDIAAEVASRRAELDASKSAVDVARQAIASAEEAYRVTDALVRAGSATTTDLLDAQSALTQARLNLERARYEQAIAHVTLQRAMGNQ